MIKFQLLGKKMKVKIFIVISLLITNFILADEDGGELFSYVKLGVDAKTFGLGKAVSSNDELTNAFYYNPALTALFYNKKVSFSMIRPFSKIDDITGYSASYQNYSEIVNYGFMLFSLFVDDIREADENGNLTGNTFSDNEYFCILNISKEIYDYYGIGINLKYFKTKIYNYSGNVYALDLGGIYKVEKFSIGLAIQNLLTTDLKLKDEEEKPDISVQLGFTLKIFHDLNLSCDLKMQERKSLKQFYGINYYLNNYLDFYSGYNNETENFTFGFGLVLKKYLINYSLSYNEDLDIGHRLTLDMRF